MYIAHGAIQIKLCQNFAYFNSNLFTLRNKYSEEFLIDDYFLYRLTIDIYRTLMIDRVINDCEIQL